MTPAAITPAARRSRRARTQPDADGERPRGQLAGATFPRRVSGPVGGRASRAGADAPAGRAAAPTLPRPVRAPRPRVGSGGPAVSAPRQRVDPSRSPARGRELPRRFRVVAPRPARQVAGPLPQRLLGALRRAPDHPLLDRIVRGRAWIALLGLMLVGIVAMQVEVLKYGASIGRALQNISVLQSRNELLRASVSALSSDQRIEREAARMGMTMPAPGEYAFLRARPELIGRALRSITPPSPSFSPAPPTTSIGG